jgi:hypothetical protein
VPGGSLIIKLQWQPTTLKAVVALFIFIFYIALAGIV